MWKYSYQSKRSNENKLPQKSLILLIIALQLKENLSSHHFASLVNSLFYYSPTPQNSALFSKINKLLPSILRHKYTPPILKLAIWAHIKTITLTEPPLPGTPCLVKDLTLLMYYQFRQNLILEHQ